MSWLWVAITAQGILGSSAVFDKLLLRKRSIEPWAYTFWLGIFGALAVLLLPFGFTAASSGVILLALVAGSLFTAAFLFQFSALEVTEASETLPIIGALAPILTLGIAALFLGGSLGSLDVVGFAALVASGLVLAIAERTSRRGRTIILSSVAALLFAASTVAAKAVFAAAGFITGFFWVKVGGVLAVLALLTAPRIRSRIFAESKQAAAGSRLAYFLNRGYAGLGSLLVSFAVSLGSPALVEATANFRYLVIFTLGALVLRERFRGLVLAIKLVAAVLIAVGLAALAGGEYARGLPPVDPNRPIAWGVTFSPKFSRELGLDWRENYRAVLSELGPQRLRLIAYWDETEPHAGVFVFDDLDWQIREAERRGVPFVLALGLKTPRWPECHIPAWAQALNKKPQEAALHEYLGTVVKRYRDRPLLRLWQVENEPLLWFGKCPARGEGFLSREIALVRSLDATRSILATDGGELGDWARVARHGDVFGTTMYRKVYPRLIGPLFGVVEYPLGPGYFRIKERFVRWWNQAPRQRFLVIELQGEPWFPTSLAETPLADQMREFSPEYFRDTIAYAKATGFEEYYLWGAEWWFWMKERHNDRRYWDTAEELFRAP